jgi:hypothetical protein
MLAHITHGHRVAVKYARMAWLPGMTEAGSMYGGVPEASLHSSPHRPKRTSSTWHFKMAQDNLALDRDSQCCDTTIAPNSNSCDESVVRRYVQYRYLCVQEKYTCPRQLEGACGRSRQRGSQYYSALESARSLSVALVT